MTFHRMMKQPTFVFSNEVFESKWAVYNLYHIQHSISRGLTVISVLSFHFNLLGQLVHSAGCKGLLEMIQFSFHRWLKVFQLKFRESE